MTNAERFRLSTKAIRVARWREVPKLAGFILISAAMLACRTRSHRKWHFSLNDYELSLGISGASGFSFVMEVIVGEAYRAFAPLLRDPRHNGVVLDCGANVGFFALWALRQNPALTVYALEPHPATYASLCEHTRVNALTGRILPYQFAARSRDGAIDVDVCDDSNLAVIGEVLERGKVIRGRRVPVRMVSLDSFCAERRIKPALVKIDVEGYEVDVLSGARVVLDSASGVILEAHSPVLADACTAKLIAHGFQVNQVDGLPLGRRD